ncbi:MAG: hypothetical protein KAG95_05475 [Bacteroidales bacterium]|nr:hypothetical protein [Bacteroidales bacterium]
MYRKLLIILACLFIHSSIFANFDFNKNCNNTFRLILNLQFNDALKNIELEKKVNPDNKLVYYFENYINFLKTLTFDTEDDYFAYKNKVDYNLNKLKQANNKSPYFIYTQADIHFQSAILSYKFKDFFLASYHFYKAYKLIYSNFEKYPEFYQNYKLIGSLNLLISSVPVNYKWFADFFIIDGSINSGIKELEYFYLQSKKTIFNTESIIFLSFAYQNFLQNNKRAYIFLKQTDKDYINNPILCFLYAKACAEADKNNEAVNTIENYLKNNELPIINFFYYFLGTTKLNRLDNDADIYLKKYLSKYNGKNFIKASYQKMAWYYLINNNYVKYNDCINKVKKLGSINTEADKQAYLEVNQSVAINEVLLKARLLFDGGYFLKAENLLLENSKIQHSSIIKDKIEYSYRLARIYHKLNMEEAKKYYQLVIANGSEMPYYFAKNSALQLALIYESELDFGKADFYFNKCLNIKSNEYKKSIQFKAKAGLNRINK